MSTSQESTSKLRVAIIGLGHWGPNLMRNFADNPAVHLAGLCDRDPAMLKRAANMGVPTTTDSDEILNPDSAVDAVVISTPVVTHHALASQALRAGKHVFIEKPLARTVAECEDLLALAAARDLTLMVGHVFLYNAGVRYVKTLLDAGELGAPLFLHSQRTSFGPVRQDVNALWDLATHDVSIFNYWLSSEPIAVSCVGSKCLGGNVEDVVTATYEYPSGVNCQVLASWLHPQKVRQITVVGARKMAVWDDMHVSEPVRLYDKSITAKVESLEQTHVTGTFAEFTFKIQQGDLSVPHIQQSEPLRNECRHFIDSLLTGKSPISDGLNGLQVVRALAAAEESLRLGGARVEIPPLGQTRHQVG